MISNYRGTCKHPGYIARSARQLITERGGGNLARVILRYADRAGRPLSNLERCNAHARAAIERETRAGLTTYDDWRETP